MKRMSLIFLAFTMMLTLCACDSSSKYKTSGDWSLTENYMFAVEIDDYSGDIYQSGTYEFTSKVFDNSKIKAIYDIYVSKNLYNSLDELQESEFIGNVGGSDDESIEANLASGNYVYVIYNDVLGDKGNLLHIQLNK